MNQLKILTLIFLGLITAISVSAAETEEAPKKNEEVASSKEDSKEKDKEKKKEESSVEEKKDDKSDEERKGGLAKLLKKLTKENGDSIPIGVLPPLDYTTLNFGELALENIYSSILRFGQFNLKTIPYAPNSLSLEEFRKVVVRNDVDIVILTVLKPTNFDIFLYDRRTPYRIYLHSETLPEAIQYHVTKEVVEEYSKVMTRRVLFAYMQDQFFDLPREEASSFLSAEIPRWIASNRSFKIVNREILSSFTASAAVGAAFVNGSAGVWNSNLISVELGVKIIDPIYITAGVDLFAYNAIMGGIKYWSASKSSPFHYAFGLSFAQVSNSHTLAWDQSYSLGAGGMFLVPNAIITIPVVEVHFKLETHLFVPMGGGGGAMVLGVLPGILYRF